MATMDEKMKALTGLMRDGILTAQEFANIVAVISGGSNVIPEIKEKSELEKQYDNVFKNHIVNAFKSPGSCKWAELTPDMVKKGEIKIAGEATQCTYIETWIDAQNSYGAMLRKKLRLVVDENGKIIRALQEAQTSGTSLLGIIANAALKNSWIDIVKL